MSAPVRVQLSRAAGWRMPDDTVKVDRSTQWGNPYKPPIDGRRDAGMPRDQAEAVAWFRDRMTPAYAAHARSKLRGKNLACWCAPGDPCHADVLLEIANRPVCERVEP